MFTGIVEELGKVESIFRNGSSLILNINCSFARELEIGESVAVNGTCLTVSEKTENSFCADATPETFRRTSLGELSSGSFVNLERAMKLNGRFGGHIVSGHVDGTGKIASFENEENAVNIKIEVSKNLGKYIIEKGSVCVDGTSLTVTNVSQKNGKFYFSISMIPHTWKNTIFSQKKPGSLVNIECDLIGKYIEHFMNFDSEGETKKAEINEEEKNKELTDEELENFMMNFKSFH